MPGTIIALLLGLAAGGAGGYAARKSIAQKKVDSAESEAENRLRDAKEQSQKMILDAQKTELEMTEKSKVDDEARRKELRIIQKKLEHGENDLQGRMRDLQDRQEELFKKNEKAEQLKIELSKAQEAQVEKLQTIADLSKDEAKEILLKEVESIEQEALASRLHKMERQTTEELEKKSRMKLSMVMQRIASSHSSETTSTRVQIPNDDVKGRIIGKEGRNIKAIEHLTGTEVIVDDTPGSITISGFSPVRRQVARLALEKLIEDGRIHPTKIEAAVNEAKQEIARDIKKAGEDALYELGIPLTAFDPKLIQILGRLKYRTSYGQNVLRHSLEVAHISTLLAQEMGADLKVCKYGGILHDIGKAVDHDTQGAHPEIGVNIMRKFGLPEEIVYQSIGHHEDKPKTLEACIVKAADAISGARTGARRDTYEQYVQRLEELESTAKAFPGVQKVYAIQAGREVRVFVEPKQIDDFAAYRLAKDIAKQIEAELQYPGEVKVNVIRETRIVEYAR